MSAKFEVDVTSAPRTVRWKYELDALPVGTVVTSIDRVHAYFLPGHEPIIRNFRKNHRGLWKETTTGYMSDSSGMRWNVLPAVLVLRP